MNSIRGLAATVLLATAPLLAQVFRPGIPPPPEPAGERLPQLEQPAPSGKAPANRAARRHEAELERRLAEFTRNWNELMRQAQKGVWNPKQARKTRKSFERLVHCQGWLEDARDTP